jgi:hypothetical protein
MDNLSKQPSLIFDGICRFDGQGNEYWLARELMAMLGYVRWQKFEDAISRAQFSCQNAGCNIDQHFHHLPGAVNGRGEGRGSKGADFKLSRYASYLVAMCGDSRKTEIAQAQTYFAVKTREAETVIPMQDTVLAKLQLENENLKLQVAIATANKESNQSVLAVRQLDNTMLTMHGAPTVLALRGMIDQVVEIEKPTIEVIDQKSGVKFEGMTLAAIREFIAKKHGIRYKTGAQIARMLEASGNDHLISQTPRRILTDYVPTENVDTVIKFLVSDHRQLLLGESITD